MTGRSPLNVTVSAFYDPKLDWQAGAGTRRLAGRQERMRIEVESEIESDISLPARILHEVFAPDGQTAAVLEDEPQGSRDSRKLYIPDPLWWSPESPLLYTLRSTLPGGGEGSSVSRAFGLRAVSYHPAWGFLFNGEPIRLSGVCLRPVSGAQAEPAAIRAQLQGLKASGFNVIRVLAPEEDVLAICDEVGLLVAACLLDASENASLPPDEKDARAAERIRAALGHPCVVLWCADGGDGDWLQAITQQHDPKACAVCAAPIPFALETTACILPEAGDAYEAVSFFSYAQE